MPQPSIHIPKDSDLLDDIAEHLLDDDRSRSDFFREAAELQLVIEDGLADLPYDVEAPEQRRGIVRQAIYDYVDAERDAVLDSG